MSGLYGVALRKLKKSPGSSRGPSLSDRLEAFEDFDFLLFRYFCGKIFELFLLLDPILFSGSRPVNASRGRFGVNRPERYCSYSLALEKAM